MSRRTPPPRPVARNAPKVRRAPEASTREARIAAALRGGKTRTSTSTARDRSGRGDAGRSAVPRSNARKSAPRARREISMREPARTPDRQHRTRKQRSIQRRVMSARPPASKIQRTAAARPRQRLIGMLIVMTLVLALVLFKVARIQSSGGEALREAGSEQWTRQIPLPADRGTIFDRDGEELAVSIPAASVSINPKLITDPDLTLKTLTELLGLDATEQADLYAEMVATDRKGFVYVRREADAAIGEQLEQLNLVGVNVDPEDKRLLPGGETAQSVVGRSDIDGLGIAGLEEQYGGGEAAAEAGYTDILSGTAGELTREVAPQGRSIAGSEQVTVKPVPGTDLITTIDRSIQFATDQALIKRVDEVGAKSGYVIVMDTDTGDVLAMSSVKRNDEGTVEITAGNFAAVNAYEPGSVAKVVTISAALNQGTVTPETTFVVPWRREYGEVLLSDSHQHPDELMSVRQILVESSNIGTIDTMMSLGQGDWDTARQTHWEYLRRFGFGERTALDFPDESPGILKHWTDLWGSERVTVAYGQGFASTPIQMVSAINAIANDGTYVAPRLVKGFVDPEGETREAEPSATREVVTPAAAETVQQLMRSVTCDPSGTGDLAQEGVENFNVAGKTGTGLKAQPNGGYTDAAGNRVYYASFVGFFPAEDPQVTVLVSIDEPPAGDINRFGGTAAAPVFAGLVPVIAHEMGIQPPANPTSCS